MLRPESWLVTCGHYCFAAIGRASPLAYLASKLRLKPARRLGAFYHD